MISGHMENLKKNLELYIHTPFCVKKCAYCDFLSFSCDERTQLDYVKALIREISYFGPVMKDYEVSTVFVGGGTPSWLTEDSMQDIFEALHKNFDIRTDAEITIECNPGTLTARKLLVYKGCGINRLSIGLQSANDDELKILGRIHTFDQFLKTYEMARVAEFENISVDLMSGLPYQTTEKFIHSLKKIISLKPDHISVYSLMIEKGTPFYEEYKFDAVKQEAGLLTEVLPTEDEAYRIYKETQHRLKQAGYEQYEISNYAHKGKACRHNIGYWTRENYLGMGLGASSLIENVRYENRRDLYEYLEESQKIKAYGPEYYGVSREDVKETFWIGTNLHRSADPVNRKAQMEEYMFLGLRMNQGILRSDFEACFGIAIEAIYRDALAELKEEELLYMREGRIALTDKGMDLSNYAMSKFLF